jgi:hypothetical protein
MEDREIIKSFRRAREQQVRFFSNAAAKPERERWVVHEFLKMLAIALSEDELFSPKESDDVDLVFRDANFQVKELPEPDCRRSSEVREGLETRRNRHESDGALWASRCERYYLRGCLSSHSSLLLATIGIRQHLGRN